MGAGESKGRKKSKVGTKGPKRVRTQRERTPQGGAKVTKREKDRDESQGTNGPVKIKDKKDKKMHSPTHLLRQSNLGVPPMQKGEPKAKTRQEKK